MTPMATPTAAVAARRRGDMRTRGEAASLRRREMAEMERGARRRGQPAVWRKLESHLRVPPWRK
jgi:hypothetical protein